jgi:hypothetical protein
MPRFEFWPNDKEAIIWTFDRPPLIGEEVVLGRWGVYRVTWLGVDGAQLGTAYTCEFVREPTGADLRALFRRGVHRLPELA